MFDCASLLDALEKELRATLNSTVTTFMATARTRLEGAVAEVAKERAKGLAEVAEVRATALVEVDARRRELAREVETMHKHKEAQEGRVELNIGGIRYQTSVQALRHVPHTFFDAYFSGRYAQDVCDDGSIFVDRDGEHFGHVLQYMRDGVVSVAEPGARPSVSLLRALKREFGFYCIELVVEQAVEPERSEVAYVMGGYGSSGRLSSMERYDASSGQWSAVAAMRNARYQHSTCVLAGELYVTGGYNVGDGTVSSVEMYTPSSDTWSGAAPMPDERSAHVAVAVGSSMYVLGGADEGTEATDSVHKFVSTQGTWSQVAPMPAVRYGHAACAIGSDIYVFGGQDGGQDPEHFSVFKFDTEANEWSTLAPMPHACAWHSASVLGGLVFIVGAGLNYRQVMRFDPALAIWSTLAPTVIDREDGATFVVGGCLYAVGGAGGQRSSVERYDVASDTWTAVADMLEGRRYCGAVTIGSAGPADEQDLFDSLIAKASSGRQ
jgi:N-acetylneuraminic acid mutarotase